MSGSMFDHGDVFGSVSDGDQPTVWLHIEYGDVFKSVFYFSDMFGNLLYFGAVLKRLIVIDDVYWLQGFILVTR